MKLHDLTIRTRLTAGFAFMALLVAILGATALSRAAERGGDPEVDQTTQQNAALVEESAAAAESLNSQAHRLVEAVSVFRLQATHAAG